MYYTSFMKHYMLW